MYKRFLAVFVLALISLFWMLPIFASAIVEADGTVSIAAGANTVFLDQFQPNLVTAGAARYSHIIIWTSSGASTINVTFNEGRTATTSNMTIPGGASISTGLAGFSRAVNAINYFGGGTTGTLSWVAW